MMQDIFEKILRLLRRPVQLQVVVFALWLCLVLGISWGTIPLLNPPSRLFVIVQMLFYRDYIF